MRVGRVPVSDRVTKDTVVDFNSIFKSIFNLKLSEQTLNELEYIYGEYQDFMDVYDRLPGDDEYNCKQIYDYAMCMNETLYLHSMELNNDDEELNLVASMAENNEKKYSIKYASEIQLSNHVIRTLDIKRLHAILMHGITLENSDQKSFRTSDTTFVGYLLNPEEKYVQYYPPFSEDIEPLLEQVLTYLNDPELNKKNPNTYLDSDDVDFHKKYAIFVQPLITQALMTIIQPFPDGNSRTSRLINCAAMLDHANKVFEKDYHLPLLYLSKFYFPYNQQYREYMELIAVEPTDAHWNQWILMGLRTMEDYMEYGKEFIEANGLMNRK